MGRELFERHAGFRASLERADRLARAHCGESPLAALFDQRHARQMPFDRLVHTHPAIFMVEYALATVLMAAGVQPDLVLGASLGTFAAAAVAGHIDPDAALYAVIDQARAVEAHCEPGAMVAVMGEPAACLTPELLSVCELGARNFATHSVISLPAANLPAVERHLRQHGVVFQRLPVNYAFHSRWIEAARLPCQQALGGLHIREGNISLVCCATGDSLRALPGNHFWSAVREPILFHQALHRIESQGHHRYIDVGPAGTLATFLKYGLPAGSRSSVHQVMAPFGSDLARFMGLAATGQAPNIAGSATKRQPGNPPQDERIMHAPQLNAVIFPGQGSQFRGMGKALFPLFPEICASASEILGYSLEELCLNDSQGKLSQTQFTQPAIFVVNALHYHRQQQLQPDLRPDFFAGHSLGEYNALLAAGVFTFETGLRLVKKRGELMAAAKAGGMAAVIGVAAQDLRALLDRHGLEQVDIANFNSPTQTVIAGEKGAIAEAAALFSRQGLRCVTLDVGAAFHSRLMQPARAEFAEFLQQFSFAAPRVAVIANATARPYDPGRIAQTLAGQIAAPVQWVDSVRYLMGQVREQGDIAFQEIGANVLTKMVLEIRAKETPIVDALPGAQPVRESKPEAAAVHEPQPQPSTARSPQRRVQATSLGSEVFRRRFGLKFAYMAGAMYRGVASAELVIRMGQAGFLSFFGSGGLSLAKIDANIVRIQAELKPGQPYGMNLLANYEYPAQEEAVVDLYLKRGIRTVEAAAFMQMTPSLVRFRLLGLRTNARGETVCDHRIVAKISRPEVARAFMLPPPAAIVEKLLAQGLVTPQQARLAQGVPVSHDVCVEADSGGHTDGGIAAVMLPPLLRLRDELQRTHAYAEPICMGLAGGIGGPEAAAAAFLLGADFIMTGSINQCTVEAGMSDEGKSMLQEIDIQDTEYAPAGDMFEIGAQVQVMKKSVFFPARANKLLSLYRHYNSLDEIPERTRRQLETTFFKRTFDDIWHETANYFRSAGQAHEIAKAEANPKHRMALVFRWYFAYCTRIAMDGTPDDRVNYQIQTGPALGSFNQWVKGTNLEPWRQRHVDAIAVKVMEGAAQHLASFLARFIDRAPLEAEAPRAQTTERPVEV